jgi:hypothetical protein
MTELEQNLQQIMQEKTDKIIPENIKEGVQIYDVIGTLRTISAEEQAEMLELIVDILGE